MADDKKKEPGLGKILKEAYDPRNWLKGANEVADKINDKKEDNSPPKAVGKPDDKKYSRGGGVARRGFGKGRIC